MTNMEIIAGAMLLAEISPDVEVDTFAGWKRNGYRVKKGEKASFQTKIWKPCKVKPKSEDDEPVEEKVVNNRRLYLVNASFFTENQVEKEDKKNVNA